MAKSKGGIRSEELRQRVTILNPTRGESPESGEPVVTYAAGDTVRAAVEVTSAQKAEQAKQPTYQAAYRITLRYRADLTPNHRLRFDGRDLSILSMIDPKFRREQLDIAAAEVGTGNAG